MPVTVSTSALLKLVRFDRPIGTLLLLWPTLGALWIAAEGTPEPRLVVIFCLGTLLMPLFACRKWEGIPTAREGQTLKWVRANDLRTYPMPPADIPLIPILRDWL